MLSAGTPAPFTDRQVVDIPIAYGLHVASSALLGDRFLDELYSLLGLLFPLGCLAAVAAVLGYGLLRRGASLGALVVLTAASTTYWAVALAVRASGDSCRGKPSRSTTRATPSSPYCSCSRPSCTSSTGSAPQDRPPRLSTVRTLPPATRTSPGWRRRGCSLLSCCSASAGPVSAWPGRAGRRRSPTPVPDASTRRFRPSPYSRTVLPSRSRGRCSSASRRRWSRRYSWPPSRVPGCCSGEAQPDRCREAAALSQHVHLLRHVARGAAAERSRGPVGVLGAHRSGSRCLRYACRQRRLSHGRLEQRRQDALPVLVLRRGTEAADLAISRRCAACCWTDQPATT